VKEFWRCSRNAIVTSFVILLLAGCASNSSIVSNPETAPSGSGLSDNQTRARIRLQLAVGYYEQRQMEIALDEVRQALQADPGFADAYSVRGLIQMDMLDNRMAEESFLQAIKLVPNNPDFNNNYGWFLCQTGRERQSIAYFDAALKNRAYQSPAKALNNAGACSMKINDRAAAERYFLQAFKIEPGNAATNANLGRLYYASHDYTRAQFYLRRLTKGEALDPDLLWLAIKIERKLGDQGAEASLVTQLRRRHPDSPEYAAYQRGAFDE
jgi:type IV pilus assembly protein PilF